MHSICKFINHCLRNGQNAGRCLRKYNLTQNFLFFELKIQNVYILKNATFKNTVINDFIRLDVLDFDNFLSEKQ